MTFDDPLVRPGSRTLAAMLVLIVALFAAAAVPLVQRAFAPAQTTQGKGQWQLYGSAELQDQAFSGKLPDVAPIQYLDVPRDRARQINASIPFSTDPNPPAAPLRLSLGAADQARATDCLAAAAWYEAGDDPVGEQAVIQVVLNRMRHPAFPKSVCGVVFQGAERATGCQFSFTCDGSMQRRRPASAGWARSRALAIAALGGLVFSPVGHATHYHTDWVVPNWSRSVDKITEIHTHLFFRWRGGAGRPPAFSGRHQGSEPTVPVMAGISGAHSDDGTPKIEVPTLDGDAAVTGGEMAAPPPVVQPNAPQLRGNQLAQSDAEHGQHVITIAPGTFPGSLAVVALDLCRKTNKPCTVAGYLGTPGKLSTDTLGRTRWDRRPDFYYFSDRSRGRETALWNCQTLRRNDQAQCMRADFAPEN